jgi:hypothetical protein
MNASLKSLASVSLILFSVFFLRTNSANAEDNWSSNYTLPSASQAGVQLLQADLIKKGESDYYDNLGQTYIGQVNTNYLGPINTYYQEGNFNTISSTSDSDIDITSYYSTTSTIGSQTNSTTDIDNSGSGDIDVTNTSDSVGDQDSSVKVIDSNQDGSISP